MQDNCATVEAGWASRSLDDSFQQAEAVGMGIWQLVLIYTVLMSDVSISRWLLVIPHLAVFVTAGLIAVRRAPAWPILPLMCPVLVLDYRAVIDMDSALWFACFWTSLIFTGMPVILLPLKRAVWFALLALASTLCGQLWWHSKAGFGPLVLTVVVAIALAIAMVMLMSTTRAYATEADNHEALAARERERLMLQRAVAQAAAEDARVMHDTLINTLSVIAGGSGVVTTATAQVRDRCRRDAETVDAMLHGHVSDEPHPRRFQPERTAASHGIALRRTGVGEEQVERHFALLPPRVAAAMQGSVDELIRNAAKHSGTEQVILDIRARADSWVVTVSDDGRGFDGRSVPGRGLAESVVARSHDAGIDVIIQSTPGNGTTVTLTVPLHDPTPQPRDSAPGSTSANRVIDMIQRTACWRFAAVAVGFGAVYVVVSRPANPAAAYLMLVVVAATAWTAARVCRDGHTLPTWTTGVMLAAIPVGFLAGLASIDFGRSGVMDWPIIVVTTLPVILLITRETRTAFFVGVIVLLLTAAVTTYVVWHATSSAAAIVPAGVVTQLAIISAWVVIRHVMDAVGAQHQRTLREMADDRLERATRDRIVAARARWVAAGARRSVAVLRRIAGGQAHPSEPAVQRECAEAERYLRQLLLLSPDTVHMTPWIVRALSVARRKAVTLNLRPGAVDTPDEHLAAAFGQVVLSGLDALPPRTELSLGLFPGAQGPHLLLVGPRGSLRSLTTPAGPPDPYTLTRRHYGKQDIVELAPAKRLNHARPSPVPFDLRAPRTVDCRG